MCSDCIRKNCVILKAEAEYQAISWVKKANTCMLKRALSAVSQSHPPCCAQLVETFPCPSAFPPLASEFSGGWGWPYMVGSVSNSRKHAHSPPGSLFGDILSSAPNSRSCSAPWEVSGRHCSSLSHSFGYVLEHMASVFLPVSVCPSPYLLTCPSVSLSLHSLLLQSVVQVMGR